MNAQRGGYFSISLEVEVKKILVNFSCNKEYGRNLRCIVSQTDYLFLATVILGH